MGCLGIGLAALLAFAIPASIAHTSIVGAYVVLAILAAVLAAAVVANARRRSPDATGSRPKTSTALIWVGVLTVVYAVAVAVIHGTR